MKSISKKIFSILVSLFVIWSVCYAFTTKTFDYKKGNYSTYHQVASSDDNVWAKKSAWWSTGDTEATVRIDLQTKLIEDEVPNPDSPEPGPTTPGVSNANFLFVADVSQSAYNHTGLGRTEIERDIILPLAKSIVANGNPRNNKVAFCEFAQGIFLYSSSANNSEPKLYYAFQGDNKVSNRRYTVADGEAKYNDTYNKLTGSMDGNYAKWFTNENEIANVVTNAYNHSHGDPDLTKYTRYTNIDTFLLYANKLKESGRNNYIFVFSDGVPDPIAVRRKSGAVNELSLSVDGMLTTGKGLTSGTGKNRAYLLSDKYPFNLLYRKAAANFRSGGNEIFFIETGADVDYKGQIYPIWNNITEGISIPDDLSRSNADLATNLANAPAACKRTDTDHIKRISANTAAQGRAQIDSIIQGILEGLGGAPQPATPTQPEKIKVPRDLSCTVTDVINYDLFDIVDKSWSSNINSSKITYNSSTKTISWPISGIKYGSKCSDGNWPYITFKIKLNANGLKQFGQVNTNYIKNVGKSNDEDKSCKVTGIPKEFTVPSPWLPRTPKGEIKVRYVFIDATGAHEESKYTTHDKNLAYKEYSKDRNKSVTKKDFNYIGYDVENDVVSSKIYTQSSVPGNKGDSPVKVTLTEQSPKRLITFLFTQKSQTDIKLEFKHYDVTHETYFDPGDSIVRSFKDISDIVTKFYASGTNTHNSFISILNNTSDGMPAKINKIIELVKTQWEDNNLAGKSVKEALVAAKSIYTANYVTHRLEYINNKLDLRIDSNSPVALSEKVTNNGIQYIPTLDSVKSAITSVGSQIKSGSTITITFYYICKHQVDYMYLDADELPSEIHIAPASDGNVVVYDDKDADVPIENVERYTYGYYTPTGNNGTKCWRTDGIVGNNVHITNVKGDMTVKLYYYKNRPVITKHLDVDNKSFPVAPQEADWVPIGSNINKDAKSGHLLDNGISYYELYKVVNDRCKVNTTTRTTKLNSNTRVNVEAQRGDYKDPVDIEFYYKKWWKVNVYYKDEDTNSEVAPSKHYFTEQHSSIEEKYINLVNEVINGEEVHYRFKQSEATSPVIPKSSSPTIKVDDVTGEVTIIFWYKKLPSIESELIPEADYDIGDPSDPSNPFNYKPERDGQIIVLDDLFTIKMDIENYNLGEEGSEIMVSLPFDVYAKEDAVNQRPANGEFFVAASEISVDKFGTDATSNSFKYTFRLPSWVVEKVYEGNDIHTMCHTVIYGPNTVGGEKEIIDEEWIKIRVVGRVYDFTVTNLEGDDKWSESLFGNTNKGKEYKADTLPIGQRVVNSKLSTLPNNQTINTQNPTWKYGMKLGSKFLFSVNTKGLVSDQIHIIPRLVYFEPNGTQRNDVKFTYKIAGKGEVDFAPSSGLVVNDVATSTNPFNTQLTYTKRFNSEVQTENTRAGQMKALGTIIPPAIAPITRQDGVSIKNAYVTFTQGRTSLFGTYKDLVLPNTLRLPYVNYASDKTSLSEVQKIGISRVDTQNNVLKYITSNNAEYMQKMNNNGSRSVKLNENQIINSLGHWYADYKLPATLKVRDGNGKELNSGYILVEFKISTNGLQGSKYYQYLNYMSQLSGNNIKYNQWYLENTHITSQDSNASVPVNFPQTSANPTGVTKQVNIKDGYYPVAVYDASISVNDNVEPVITH
ncbi:MAG: hypothetical protein IKI57_01150 [Clostridia bacterium]|nr:hypothetical protein [Clostridia bacterium]